LSNKIPKEYDMAEKEHSSASDAGESIEARLMRELRFGGIEKDNLKELVGIVAGFQKGGLKRMKAFPKGVPPLVDGLRVSGMIDAGEVNIFLSEVLTKTPRLSGLVVFPYGIPWPEIFRIGIDLGATVDTGPLTQF
jgi:hypothetical protein